MRGIRNLTTGKWMLPMVVYIFISCGENKKPEGIYSREEMVNVLMDIYIVEEKVNRLTLKRDSAEMVFALMQEKIFQKQNLSDSAFKHSMNYYLDRPKEMEMIYTALVDSLQLLEQRVSIQKEKK